jgi:hypothetical protein
MDKARVGQIVAFVIALLSAMGGFALGLGVGGRTGPTANEQIEPAGTRTVDEQLSLSACKTELESYETAYESCDGTRAWLLTQYDAAKDYHTELLACREGSVSTQAVVDDLRNELRNALAERNYYTEHYRVCLLSQDGEGSE